ncbi:MAG: M23 family metallopeptidase [Roseovarius sp.]|jgi:murein DD-endopeptidase MepM/ murein hydrolase activator NlpD|nr:M23 family metallopeptidase [Roseovarius sp.]
MPALQLFSLRQLAAQCLFAGALLIGAIAHAQVYKSDGNPVLARAKSVPRGINLCNDYASKRDYSGAPYRVVEPDRIVTRHEGIDFCASAGTPVIAPVAGTIRWAIKDHPLRGGQVLIKTGFRVDTGQGGGKPVYIGLVHITPLDSLRKGSRVKPGEVIGHVRKAGLVEIGSRSHVHFTARICDTTHKCHFDPNLLWQDGLGKVSCFRAGQAVAKGRIVAPIACR